MQWLINCFSRNFHLLISIEIKAFIPLSISDVNIKSMYVGRKKSSRIILEIINISDLKESKLTHPPKTSLTTQQTNNLPVEACGGESDSLGGLGVDPGLDGDCWPKAAMPRPKGVAPAAPNAARPRPAGLGGTAAACGWAWAPVGNKEVKHVTFALMIKHDLG